MVSYLLFTLTENMRTLQGCKKSMHMYKFTTASEIFDGLKWLKFISFQRKKHDTNKLFPIMYFSSLSYPGLDDLYNSLS